MEEDEYLVLSTYWKHAKYSDFSRITTVVSQRDTQELDVALVQYKYEGEEQHISPKKNPRTKKPFISTASSTRQSIEDKVKRPMGPSTIYNKVFEEASGMMEVEAVSNAPRNIKQVKNARAKLKRQLSFTTNFHSLLYLGQNTTSTCKGLTHILPLSCGFNSSVGRALHRHRRVVGSFRELSFKNIESSNQGTKN